MEAILNNIGVIITLLTTIVGWNIWGEIRNKRLNKKLKEQEVFIKEQEVLSKKQENTNYEVERLKEALKDTDIRVRELQRELIEKDSQTAQMRKEKHIIDVKHSKNKGCINAAYSCRNCDNVALHCPVLIMKAQNDMEYLETLQKKEV